MTPKRRIFLNIVATYGRSLYALVIGLFCGRWTLMALGEFGAPLAGVSPSDFAVDGTIFQIGVAPCRIDVINKIDGVSYADASPRAIPKTIEGVPVRIISREDLIINKRASGRTKDLADAEILEELGK